VHEALPISDQKGTKQQSENDDAHAFPTDTCFRSLEYEGIHHAVDSSSDYKDKEDTNPARMLLKMKIVKNLEGP